MKKELMFSFICALMGAMSVMAQEAEKLPTVIYCTGDVNTMYITGTEEAPVEGDTWEGQTVSHVWSGNQLLNMGWNTPGWYSSNPNNMIARYCNKVVIDESFAQFEPTSLYAWFSNMKFLTTIEGLENLNTSKVTNMNSMFLGCDTLTTINVNSFDVSKVTNATGMFRACKNLTTIYCDNEWNIGTTEAMFLGSTKLVGAVAYDQNHTDGTMANPLTGYFTTNMLPTVIYCRKFVNDVNVLTMYITCTDNPPVEGGTWEGQTVNHVWRGLYLLNMGTNNPDWYDSDYSTMIARHCTKVIVDESFARFKPTSFYRWFANMRFLSRIEGIEYLNTSEATNLSQMFSDCQNLKTIDVNTFDVSKVADASKMFAWCTDLTTIYCENSWDLTNATTNEMFHGSINLEGAVAYDYELVDGAMANPETGYFTYYKQPTVIYCRQQVGEANVLTLFFTNTSKRPVEEGTWEGQTINHVWSGNQLLDMGWNTPGWYDADFYSMTARYCSKVVIDESFAELKPKSLYAWFANMKYLSKIEGLEYLNTSETTIMNSMFMNCESLEKLDVNTFDVSKVENATKMFGWCQDLTTIYCDNSWDLTNAATDEMFRGCVNLVGAVPYDNTKVDGAMANPETGYFTKQATWLRGDVNGDGDVNVMDITALIDIIMNDSEGPRADVNEDGDINVMDITALIDIIMNM